MRSAGREGGEACCLISGISLGVSAGGDRGADISRAGHGLGDLASPLGAQSSWGTYLSALSSANYCAARLHQPVHQELKYHTLFVNRCW